MSGRSPESPGLPERTGSHPATFRPASFATRSTPTYPTRIHYEAFDPARPQGMAHHGFPRSNAACNAKIPTPIENRAGSEPHTGWRGQNVEVESRHNSVPPALEIASEAFRERQLYSDRTMDEITDFTDPPIVEQRRWVSEPVTRDVPTNWGYAFPQENNPQPTYWIGYDNSTFALCGGVEDFNETAAFANEDVLESVELESDPLVALRQLAKDSQRTIRSGLERQIDLEDRNERLATRGQRLLDYTVALKRSQQQSVDALVAAAREQDRYRRERDLARAQVERLRLQINEPEEELRQRQAQYEAYEEGLHREAGLREDLYHLRQSEASLLAELQSEIARADQLQVERDQLDYQREGYQMQRDHYRDRRDLEREWNGQLQEQIQDLAGQLAAAQALLVQPPVNQPLVNAAANVPPPAVQHPVNAHPTRSARLGRGGRNREGARGRAGRGGRGAATGTRKQPRRSCRVEKSYRS